MANTPELDIRLLTEADLPDAMRLKNLAGWNQTEEDWRRLLRLAPEGCFAARLDGKIVATTTTTAFGQELAWIGMVLVDPEYRRRGIATQLMRIAIDYLQRIGVRTIKLDATPAGRPVYEALGFTYEALVERWEATAASRPSSTDLAVDKAAALSEAVLELDRQAFGTDRSALLAELCTSSNPPLLLAHDSSGQLRGFAFARPGTKAQYIGPIAASDAATALALFDHHLTALAGQRVFIDFHTGFPVDVTFLAERGFTKQRDLIRMGFGQPNPAGTSDLVFAIAGPEIG